MPPSYWHPEWVELAQTMGEPPVFPPQMSDERTQVFNSLMIAASQHLPPPPENVVTRDFDIPDGPKVRVYKPTTPSPTTPPPLILFLHGGGWFAGNLDTEDRSARMLCSLARSWIVSVDYTCGADIPLHQQVDSCYRGFIWAQMRAADHGADPQKIIIWGGSAGAAWATALVYRLVQEGKGDRVAGLISMNGLHLHPDATPGKYRHLMTSYVDNAGPLPLVTGEATLSLYEWWDAVPPKVDVRLFPAAGGADAMKGFPPTFLVTSDNDASRDDGTVMEAGLEEAGVPVKRVNFVGVAHYFWTFDLPRTNETFWRTMAGAVDWILERK